MIILFLLLTVIQSKVMEKLSIDHKNVLIPLMDIKLTANQIVNIKYVKQPVGYNTTLYYKDSDKKENPATIDALKSYKALSD